ncbi:SCC4 factor, partial [Polyodon spathula]|nr:SCC4 factor [Polyodon spathula]
MNPVIFLQEDTATFPALAIQGLIQHPEGINHKVIGPGTGLTGSECPLSKCSHCLRAAAFYIRGLFSFFQGRYNEAKKFLRETLKMSNAEDLNRLTACSLVLLGHIFYVLGNHRESNNMVVPAMQLASKIPDMSVQLWSSALLKDLNKACGNTMDAHEAAQMHQNFSQQLLQDHIAACSLPEHNLITWTDGPPPVQFQAQNGPTTSLASLL